MGEHGASMGTGVGAGMGIGRRRLIAGAAAAAVAMATGTVVAAPPPSREDGPGGSPQSGGGIAPHYAAATADTVYQSFDGTHFIAADSVDAYAYVIGGGITATTSARNEFRALLALPQGATVTEVVFSLLHNNMTGTYVTLYTYDAAGNLDGSRKLYYTTQSASIVNVSLPLGTPLVVDNSTTTYILRWEPGAADSTDTLYGARVGYTLPSASQVYGAAAAGTGVYGTTATGSYAVAGHALQNVGVYGLSEGGPYPYGVVGRVNVAGGFALFGNASQPGSVAFGGTAYGTAIAGQFIGPVNVYGQITLVQHTQPPDLMNPVNAFIVGPGVTKNAAVEMPDGTHALMHCVEAPEPWFEDFGEGTLVAGKAEIKLEAAFAHTVNTDTLHVFLTAHGDGHHLNLAGRTAAGFTVGAEPSAAGVAQGKKASDLNGTFTYRVVAKRRDVKGDRLMRVTLPKPVETKLPPMPKP